MPAVEPPTSPPKPARKTDSTKISNVAFAADSVAVSVSACGSSRATCIVEGEDTARDVSSSRHARNAIRAASEQMKQFQQHHAAKDNPSRCYTISRRIVENSVFVCFTMVLTIYALLADDFRLMLTGANMDPFFNWMVVMCIFVFTVECGLSILGKADYLWSFFFWLDVISTISLVLDITIVADELFATQQDAGGETGSEVRGGRAAKLGAKAGRVVRVLRLVRILKLYKAYHDAKTLKNRKRKQAVISPGDDDDWDDEDPVGEKDFDKIGRESHVGRKLSELTTRRVICIIMAMMLGLQILQIDDSDKAAFSSLYGAEVVWQKFRALLESEDSPDAGAKRVAYESALLQYIYYHNWFALEDTDKFCPKGSCSGDYYAQLFWVGFIGESRDKVERYSRNATISITDISEYETRGSDVDSIFNFGLMPSEAHDILTSSWDTDCDLSDTRFSRGTSLLKREIEGTVGLEVPCPATLRKQEWLYVTPRQVTRADLKESHMAFYFDLRPFMRQESMLNIINTMNILVLLLAVSLVFSNDANRLIVHPVERMIKRVESIRDDPLKAINMADEDFMEEERAKAKKIKAKKEIFSYMLGELVHCRFCGDGSNQQPMETVILEKTIIKLGSLLALGFGEAGANIIGHNMAGGDSAGVNAMIPGTRVECIIGVVRICDFSTATEVLQSKIMTFVNQIAEVVHGVANEYQGAPNRNSGETFLVIWRIQSAITAAITQNSPDAFTAVDKAKVAAKMAGLSIVAFSKILGGLHRSSLLAAYRGHPGLQYRLGSHCRVNLSFGLHAGWAIEGAVGSEFKIDASYLSPNVSIATSIEKAAETYGVSLMVGQSVVELCPKSMVSKCRLIDKVIITGSPRPMEIYCLDLDYRRVSVDSNTPLGIVWNSRNRFKVRQFLREEKHRKMESGDFDVAKLFDEDQAINIMRAPFKDEFFQLFNMGYQNYSQGEWQVARRMLSCVCRSLNREDGPSSALLRYMVQYKFEAPREWHGVRELITNSGGCGPGS